MKAGLIFISLMLVPGISAKAQWKAVHGNLTTTETITKADGIVRTTTTSGEYFRSSSGSELTVISTMSADGIVASKHAELYDADSPALYTLDYGKKVAYLVARMPARKPFETNRGARYPSLQHGTIGGFDCLLVPIMLEGQRIGTVWIDDKDDLEIQREITLPGSHKVTRLSDVTLGNQADAGMFRVPPNFTVDTSNSRTVPAGR